MGNFKRGGGRATTMHKATCAKCGATCEIPFKPTGDRPVYCSNCFGQQQDNKGRQGKFGGERRGFKDRQTFSAVCEKCGKSCKVPFKPTAGKPVYCDNCFGKGGGSKDFGGGNEVMAQLKMLNNKIDKLVETLTGAPTAPKAKKEIVKKEVKAKKTSKVKIAKVKKAAKPKAKPKAKAAPKKKAAKKKK